MGEMNAVEIFSTGTHTAMNGTTRDYTAADLEHIAATYNPEQHEAPVVIGHPVLDAPAYGWVKRVWTDGQKLYADMHQLADDFYRMVREGRYKKRSISLAPDGTLRHVGFLGAVPPAVSGLANIAFSGTENDQVFEYANHNEPNITNTKTEVPTMDLEKALERITQLEAANTDYAARLEAAQTDAKTARDELENVNLQFTAYRNEARDKERQSRMKRLMEQGKVLPAESEKIMAFARGLSRSEETLEFAGTEGAKETLTLEEAYWRSIEDRTPSDLTREFATSDRVSTGTEHTEYVDLTRKV